MTSPRNGDPAPGAAPTSLLWLEWAALFIAAPLLMRVAMFDYGVPLFWALFPFAAAVAWIVVRDDKFDLRDALLRPVPEGEWRAILIPFALGAPLVIGAIAVFLPDHLFNLPRTRTKLWAKMLLLYPFTSVLAQEVIYRVIFFHRYRALFSQPWLMIAASALAFAFSHVVFRNWIAVAVTLAAGFLFAWRYNRTRSFLAVWAEHTLWGWLLFTCGLGIYFFANSKNPLWN